MLTVVFLVFLVIFYYLSVLIVSKLLEEDADLYQAWIITWAAAWYSVITGLLQYYGWINLWLLGTILMVILYMKIYDMAIMKAIWATILTSIIYVVFLFISFYIVSKIWFELPLI